MVLLPASLHLRVNKAFKILVFHVKVETGQKNKKIIYLRTQVNAICLLGAKDDQGNYQLCNMNVSTPKLFFLGLFEVMLYFLLLIIFEILLDLNQ